MGVEEEFVLVDPVSGLPVPLAKAVLAKAELDRPQDSGVGFHQELVQTQVESVTDVRITLAEVADALREGRRRLAAAATAQGSRLLATGTPVFSGPPAPITEGTRFRQIADRYAGVLDDYQSCGCHVHVGVPDRETAVAVVNHLRPWLPTLLALSANSPFHAGRDTGYASWRIMLQARFPGSGVPPPFTSLADHDRRVALRVATGTSIDPGMTAWLARPSPSFPTVEVRVADVATTIEDALVQAALTRALVATALGDLAAGREAVPVRDDVAEAAVWAAARYGVAGVAVHPHLERQVPVRSMVDELVARVAPELEARGELSTVRRWIGGILIDGGGAGRQRHAAELGWEVLLDRLAVAGPV